MSTDNGFFVTIDGPSGIGKTTIAAELAGKLASRGFAVLATKEPTATPLGSLTRFGTDEYRGLTLACLVAADRYQHLEHEIRPALKDGKVVVCDRYIASSLVLQRMDGVAPEFLWQLNALAERPDLTIFLLGDPASARQRAERRGLYSRFHRGGQAAGAAEAALYRLVAAELRSAGHDVLLVEISERAPADIAGAILMAILARRQDPA